jgi:hypothetical protein
MDGKYGWGWAILLAPVAVWTWVRSLFDGKPPPPPAPNASRWTESTWQDTLSDEERDTWREPPK